MQIKKIYFKTTDKLSLIGLLHMPEEKQTRTCMISVHGITSNCLRYRDDVIAQKLTKQGIAYFTFDNRGHDIINTYDSIQNGYMNFYGSGAENIYDCDKDIEAAIKAMLENGYSQIILQGHSLGATKVVYSYNQFVKNNLDIAKNIVGISLLSLVDVPQFLKVVCGDNYKKVINYLKLLEKKKKGNKIVSIDGFPPIMPRTILNCMEESEIDFARYSDDNYEFNELNNIKVPLFMRWGNNKELIAQDAQQLVKKMNEKITNKNKDINFIDKANHNYKGKEEILANQISEWIYNQINLTNKT